MMKRLALILALLFPWHAFADVVVIVNAANPVHSMSAEEVSALYLARSRTFPSGEFALVFDQPRDSALRQQFFKLVANMAIGQVNTYWSRLMFSGQEMPPQSLPNEQAVIDIVRRNPGAIGYVSVPPKETGLRVVLQIKE
jgi:ABC-type phosphate transport system substrate-binding protein